MAVVVSKWSVGIFAGVWSSADQGPQDTMNEIGPSLAEVAKWVH